MQGCPVGVTGGLSHPYRGRPAGTVWTDRIDDETKLGILPSVVTGKHTLGFSAILRRDARTEPAKRTRRPVDPLKQPGAISLAKRTVGVMKQNIAISLITVVALLVGVFAGGVTMSISMLVHEASVLTVIINAMRLLRNTKGQIASAGNGQSPTPAPTSIELIRT